MVISIPSYPAYASLWIRPETCIYHCALILPLEYLFPFCGFPLCPLVWGKNVKSLSIEKRKENRIFFSQGVELEDTTFINQHWTLRSNRGHDYQERQSCSESGKSVESYTTYCHWFWGNLWLFFSRWISFIWQEIYENCLHCQVKSQSSISITHGQSKMCSDWY